MAQSSEAVAAAEAAPLEATPLAAAAEAAAGALEVVQRCENLALPKLTVQ